MVQGPAPGARRRCRCPVRGADLRRLQAPEKGPMVRHRRLPGVSCPGSGGKTIALSTQVLSEKQSYGIGSSRVRTGLETVYHPAIEMWSSAADVGDGEKPKPAASLAQPSPARFTCHSLYGGCPILFRGLFCICAFVCGSSVVEEDHHREALIDGTSDISVVAFDSIGPEVCRALRSGQSGIDTSTPFLSKKQSLEDSSPSPIRQSVRFRHLKWVSARTGGENPGTEEFDQRDSRGFSAAHPQESLVTVRRRPRDLSGTASGGLREANVCRGRGGTSTCPLSSCPTSRVPRTGHHRCGPGVRKAGVVQPDGVRFGSDLPSPDLEAPDRPGDIDIRPFGSGSRLRTEGRPREANLGIADGRVSDARRPGPAERLPSSPAFVGPTLRGPVPCRQRRPRRRVPGVARRNGSDTRWEIPRPRVPTVHGSGWNGRGETATSYYLLYREYCTLSTVSFHG
ncbi:uncharacterized protein LOC103165016 [Ornithorhynchus anatinus]|uniref:uncharacterized protein LOC103165016 n=1 Tax=Ornithorhynchus anatinus TaxID=9258 RepID=UPI0010A8C7AD|nr:uncharacterized protein LOC103165016 [Ornithorhynchus anatinus]